MVEKGRHQNIDRQFRYCPSCLCNRDFYIEDEFHMLLVCTLYDELKTQCFLQTWLHCEPNMELFYTILSSDDDLSIFALANYLYRAFESRNTFIKNYAYIPV